MKFIPSSIVAGAIAMVAGLVIVPVVSLLTRKPDAAEVDSIFSCYEERVSVPQNRSLVIDCTDCEEYV